MKPFIFINVAVSADGKMDTFERKSSAISSQADKERVERLRAGSDAIMVGGHTLLDEDPKLTVKSVSLQLERRGKRLPAQPAKVGIVSKADLPLDGDFMTAGPAERIIFTTELTSPQQIADLTARGVKVFVMGEDKVNLAQALETLYQLGVHRLMVEGGGTLNYELIRAGLVDELYIYMAPKIFGGNTAPTLADGTGLIFSQAIQLELLETQILDKSGGLLLHYRLTK